MYVLANIYTFLYGCAYVGQIEKEKGTEGKKIPKEVLKYVHYMSWAGLGFFFFFFFFILPHSSGERSGKLDWLVLLLFSPCTLSITSFMSSKFVRPAFDTRFYFLSLSLSLSLHYSYVHLWWDGHVLENWYELHEILTLLHSSSVCSLSFIFFFAKRNLLVSLNYIWIIAWLGWRLSPPFSRIGTSQFKYSSPARYLLAYDVVDVEIFPKLFRMCVFLSLLFLSLVVKP